ncbi:sensor histidine kinase [Catellatospora bangladeshensis]|uniref:histidine kinase n=1 Tax=Catellatospora bangladeshensis TaxID=310355 RepID=A0A8J3NKY4_9ACTN|nr:ATP-binding protein [Catellatospora bangladeshensis]GIF84940.1 two-component sensor histidine kinase [Catellatospora bangladeshensis]
MGGLRPGRTVAWRFTLLYAALFLASGAGLLALTNLLAFRDTTTVAPGQTTPQLDLARAQEHIRLLQERLDEAEIMQSRRLLAGSLIALLVMAVVSVVLGRVAARRVLRPLRTVTAATRRITADSLHERLAVAGPADEVKDLADTIDGLLERLEASFAAQRRFVADASHELRTPLATMRASVDVAMAKPEPVPAQTAALAGRVRTELDRVDRLLDGFLMLARAQHGALADRAAVSLAGLAGSALAARDGDVTARRLTVDTAGLGEAAWTVGSATLLARLVENLVDNAVIHNVDGGRVRLAAARRDGQAELVVESGGEVLDPARVAALTRPFHRMGAARTGSDDGSGLGLAIVAAVASAHGGQVDLAALPEGGLRVTVRLPAACEPRAEEVAETAGAPGSAHVTRATVGGRPGTGESGR